LLLKASSTRMGWSSSSEATTPSLPVKRSAFWRKGGREGGREGEKVRWMDESLRREGGREGGPTYLEHFIGDDVELLLLLALDVNPTLEAGQVVDAGAADEVGDGLAGHLAEGRGKGGRGEGREGRLREGISTAMPVFVLSADGLGREVETRTGREGGREGTYLDGGHEDLEVLGVGELLGVLDHVPGEGHDVGLDHVHGALLRCEGEGGREGLIISGAA